RPGERPPDLETKDGHYPMKAIEIMWKGPVKPRLLLLTSLTFVLLIFPASALATSPPSITSSFFPSSIGIGDTSTISYAIIDPTGNTTVTNAGFTDTLPTGVMVDTPNGSNVGKSCNPASPAPAASLTANSGSSTITLSGAIVKAGRDDTATVTSGSATVTDAGITS